MPWRSSAWSSPMTILMAARELHQTAATRVRPWRTKPRAPERSTRRPSAAASSVDTSTTAASNVSSPASVTPSPSGRLTSSSTQSGRSSRAAAEPDGHVLRHAHDLVAARPQQHPRRRAEGGGVIDDKDGAGHGVTSLKGPGPFRWGDCRRSDDAHPHAGLSRPQSTRSGPASGSLLAQ